MAEPRQQVQKALQAFSDLPLKLAAVDLFAALGYSSRKTINLDGSPAAFLSFADRAGVLSTKRDAEVPGWRRAEFLFQLTNDEIPVLAEGNKDLFLGEQDYRTSIIESFVFIAIELDGEDWARGALAGIAREINRIFPMPVVVLFRHGGRISLAVIDRRQNKKDGTRDVVEKRISIVKDIDLAAPHRAQIDILCDMALSEVKVRGRGTPTNFRDLYDAWIEVLSVQALNAKFYKELAYWFFWSVKQIEFPAAVHAREAASDTALADTQNQIAAIRLLTRLIFVWFIKEKGIVPATLFDPSELKKLLKEDPSSNRESSTYYKSILQNLFFATLNTEMSADRKWRTKAKGPGLDGQYLVHTVYRFRDSFREPDVALDLFRQVPFLNGGLFECLDREISQRDLERNPELRHRATKEGSRLVLRIDGFSERPDNPLKVPNKIFFAKSESVDLNTEFDTKGKKYEADGLIELFSRYKFTVEENTPVEEEVALDPELLGKVFENLLASYNADTRTTARKKSGSFYTPREVVDYMVDESLITYFERRLSQSFVQPATARRKPIADTLDLGAAPGEFDLPRSSAKQKGEPSPPLGTDGRLRSLLSFRETGNPFSERETDILVDAVESLRALDPACGSGAFPMGLLQKLIHILHRLDPDNSRWKAQNRKPLEDRLAAAKRIPDPSRREIELAEAETALEKLDHDFSDANRPDYARKLYLIDKCLFGVDIQPIAVQIAKLRFFISLVVSQKIDRDQENLNVTALPNLETKLVAANSLIPIERPAQADLFRSSAVAEKEAGLRAMNERYFSARTAKTKQKRREDIARLRDELADLLKSDRGLPEEDARKMAAWDPFDQNAEAPFFDPEWMFGLSSNFDLVIANPPYVRQEAIKELKPALEKHYGGKDRQGNPRGAYSGTADLLVYFIQRGIELLNPGGSFAYITSNKWFRAKYGERLRSWINRNATLRCILDFGDAEVFDALAYPTIIIASRREAPVLAPTNSDRVRIMNWPMDRNRSEIVGFPELVESIGFDIPQKSLNADAWQLEPQANQGVLARLRAAGMPLSQYVEGRLYRGILTGFNDAFVIDGATKDRLVSEHESSRDVIKPYLRGRDIKRWRVEPQDLWLIFLRRGTDVDAVPAIKRHLERYKKQLKPKPANWNERENGAWPGRKPGSYKWYEIQDNVAYWQKFEEAKIIVPAIQNKVDYAPDLRGFYSNDKTSIIVDARWPFLLAILNSSTSWWFTKQNFASRQNGYYEFKPMYVAQIPVPRASEKRQRIVSIVSKAIVAGAAPSQLEQLLNGLVYELYFYDDLHSRGLMLFDEAERAGLINLQALEGSALKSAMEVLANKIFQPSHQLYRMLFDLQALDVVRIIEGKE